MIDTVPAAENRVFGVPLETSITYANTAITLTTDTGQSKIYGYVPVVVAKCTVYLKMHGTSLAYMFERTGPPKHIKQLREAFDQFPGYGKAIEWNEDGYGCYDVGSVMLRYFLQLPEPVIPFRLYARFCDVFRGTVGTVGPRSRSSDHLYAQTTVLRYKQLVTELPPLNGQLLLYLLDT